MPSRHLLQHRVQPLSTPTARTTERLPAGGEQQDPVRAGRPHPAGRPDRAQHRPVLPRRQPPLYGRHELVRGPRNCWRRCSGTASHVGSPPGAALGPEQPRTRPATLRRARWHGFLHLLQPRSGRSGGPIANRDFGGAGVGGRRPDVRAHGAAHPAHLPVSRPTERSGPNPSTASWCGRRSSSTARRAAAAVTSWPRTNHLPSSAFSPHPQNQLRFTVTTRDPSGSRSPRSAKPRQLAPCENGSLFAM
jgi:hypothetical protein